MGIDFTIATETFQHTGSFKFRAAFEVAANVEQDHIIGASSGNFGQALAFACRLLGKRCHVVMPETSATVKIEAVRNYGAVADLIDVSKVSRANRVDQLLEEFPEAYRASAYDDPLVIRGNSSLGFEIAEHDDFDFVFVPVGGGGLISGISQAFVSAGYGAKLLGAEPLEANDAARSVRAGELIANDSEPGTIADGARTVSLGKHNWSIIKDTIDEILEVSEDGIRAGMRRLFSDANLKVEPTGALALGAAIENAERFKGKKLCIVVSGGNVDADRYARLIAETF